MTKSTTTYLLACALMLSACGAKAQTASAPATLQTEEQKTLYALGLLLGRNVKVFNLTADELAVVQKGFADSVTGTKPQVEIETYGQKVNEMAQARHTAGTAAEKTRGKEYLDQAAKEAGATQLPSGVVFKTVSPGTGATPGASDVVKVHYEGKLTDGTVFDSSIKRGEPAEFPLSGVIPCWTQGVAKMKVGEKAKLVCPSDQAYGDGGQPPSIPGGATLVFDVELLSIQGKDNASAPAAPAAPPAPETSAAKPKAQPKK
jgi:FKBP-type peptidyl-prolyl cis-trans isomerase FkpA